MPAPSFLDLAGNEAGSLFGGNSGGISASLLSSILGNFLTPSAPSAPQLPNQTEAAGAALTDIGSLTNPSGTLQPLELQQLMAYLNNPNIAGYMKSAGDAGAASTAAGGLNFGSGMGLLKNAGSLYDMAFDPQGSLYDKLKQQTMDQSNVINSQYGLSTSPAGAGVANDAMKNFNIDWQNQLLGRALQGNAGIGQDVTGAANLFGTGVQDILGGGALPYSAYTGVLGDTTGAINSYTGQIGAGNNFLQTQIGDLLGYLGQGTSNAASALAGYNAQQGANANTTAGLMPIFTSMFDRNNQNPFTTPPNNPTNTPAFSDTASWAHP